jgi:16S rRNA (uracil1498-N3)-methyltransferase
VEFELGEEVTSFPLSKVTLLMAIFKFDRMEWAIEKCTELGIAGIVPVVARRTDAHLASAAGNRVPRWERIVLQASEQSRRVSVPRIAEPSKLKDAVRDATGTRILLSESEKKLSLQEAVEAHSSSETLLLAVGPEGGWTDDDFVIFAQCGWVAASLGSTILRAETAAIAATAIAMSALS